ncbi:hypothetical protein FCL47_21055 [Desulfopila sp. IMCC35006]|uniref:hypothetical protein n=1 Tax=Desulfopila sp. IMCC35006 TaxID=2569542 RepID=UPI0010AB5AD8|nr:hypothetical protein [Desulfopila sp. IMCC35006]TKB23824.1 hypothetical protein FCL47_21055 [Desulfopila sp. IMCC35006]
MTTEYSIEILLAKAYDNLVDSRETDLSFTQEASLVANFTQLYIQNLFHLDDSKFRNIIDKNRELNTKAAILERQGRNPYDLLRQQILEKDDLGKLLERYSQHLGALDCILDVKATAALVHHLVNLKPSDNLPGKVVGCEFGSGLGILAIAGSIPFVHNGNFINVHAFEQSPESHEDSLKIVEILQKKSKYKDQIQFTFQLGNIITEEPYRRVKEAEKHTGPLALWISETFGYRSKKPVIPEGATMCTFSHPTGVIPYPPDLEAKYDPLPHVLDLSCRYFDSFLQKILTDEIIAFPDIVTPRVIIDGEMSSILSPDGTWRKLHEIGLPYDMLPPCVQSRWYYEEKPKTPRKRPFQTSPKKRKKKR